MRNTMNPPKIFVEAIALFSVFSLLSSCSWLFSTNHRTNRIVAGEYWGPCDCKEGISTYLKIEEINQETFENAKGINVVKDEVGGGYYSIIFAYTDASGAEKHYDYVNLKDAYNGATGTPISYRDENNSWFYPITDRDREDSWNYEDPYCSVHIFDEKNNIEIGGFLCSKRGEVCRISSFC